jgi:CheY-like chemotaxis protein
MDDFVKGKDILLTLNYDDTIPKYIETDKMRIKQVLINLLSNAIKFTSHGFVEFKIEKLNLHKETIEIQFSVIDSGIGIPRDKYEEIFSPYKQGDETISYKYGGTGLGLTVTKKILDAFNSDIILNSEQGVGSTFQFKLKSNIIQSEKIDKRNLEKNQSILIIDDDLITRKIISEFLEQAGYKTKTAEDSGLALEILKVDNFDLIILDLNLPILDGFEFSKLFRQENKTTPILAITASEFIESKDKLSDYLINEILYKPFNKQELFYKLDELLY